jgi:hypothetical protein
MNTAAEGIVLVGDRNPSQIALVLLTGARLIRSELTGYFSPRTNYDGDNAISGTPKTEELVRIEQKS